MSDSTQLLCTTIEAVFLHGLKDSLFRQTMNAAIAVAHIAAAPTADDPAPTSTFGDRNFWPVLQLISHRQTIRLIDELSQITNDIGRCRAWIRVSLNDSLLSSYLAAIAKHQLPLRAYYKDYAFVRDIDQLTLAECICSGIAACYTFALPYNSSLLNRWTPHPFQMAGIYTPALRSCPIASGFDVANSIGTDEPPPPETADTADESVTNDNVRRPDVDERRRLAAEWTTEPIANKEREAARSPRLMGNSLTQKTCWSTTAVSECDECTATSPETVLATDALNIVDDGTASGGETQRFPNGAIPLTESIGVGHHQLLDTPGDDNDDGDADKVPGNSNGPPSSLNDWQAGAAECDMDRIWERFEMSLGVSDSTGIIGNGMVAAARINEPRQSGATGEVDEAAVKELGYEIVRTPMFAGQFSIDDLRQLVEQCCNKLVTTTTTTMAALDDDGDSSVQTCKSCTTRLTKDADGQRCSVTGELYCVRQCMSGERHVIPARVIYDWDFELYAVSQRVATFLSTFRSQPFLDFKVCGVSV